MTKPEDYAYRVFWSQQDDAYIATVAEFPSLSCVEETQADAFFGIVAVVGTVLEGMAENGEEAPTPLASRTYSGKFALRIPPRSTANSPSKPQSSMSRSTNSWCRDFELRVWRHALGRSQAHAVRRTMKAAGSRARGFAELASSRALPSIDPYSSTAARCRPPASRR